MKTRTLSFAILTLGLLLHFNVFAQTLTPSAFKKQLQDEKGTLIDVRTPKEFVQEHIEGAINLDVLDSLSFEKAVGQLDKTRPYFVYCGIGKRSAKAHKIMSKNGFTRVYELEKGLNEWKKAGYPTVIK